MFSSDCCFANSIDSFKLLTKFLVSIACLAASSILSIDDFTNSTAAATPAKATATVPKPIANAVPEVKGPMTPSNDPTRVPSPVIKPPNAWNPLIPHPNALVAVLTFFNAVMN